MATELRPREEWRGSLRSDGPARGATEVLLAIQSVVGRKWHPVIVHRLLQEDSAGFNDLQESIDGVSAKMLSESLDDLEDRGLVERSVVSDKPVRVEYSLTEAGRAFDPVLEEMLSWGRERL